MLDNIDHSTPSRHIFVIIVLHLSKILHIDFQFLIFVREKKKYTDCCFDNISKSAKYEN